MTMGTTPPVSGNGRSSRTARGRAAARAKLSALLAAVGLAATGCGLLGIGAYTDAGNLAAIAAAVNDYAHEEIAAAMNSLDKDDLEGTGTAKTLYEETIIRVLPNGTVVTIEWILVNVLTPIFPFFLFAIRMVRLGAPKLRISEKLLCGKKLECKNE